MLSEFFIPSIPIGFDLVLRRTPQLCKSGVYMSDGWDDSMRAKAEHWLDAVRDNTDEVFICSDIDVVFMAKATPNKFREFIGDHDMAFQDNTDGLCGGFFIARGTKTVAQYFACVIALIGSRKGNGLIDDQVAINMLKSSIDHIMIPRSAVFTTGRNKKAVPDSIMVYHANWIQNLDDKCAALKRVRQRALET